MPNKYFEYDYVEEIPKNENQFAREFDLSETRSVDARYIHSYVAPGNPFIEALPRYLTPEEVISHYNRSIVHPSSKELENMDEYEKIESIGTLSDVRFPFTFHADVEREFHNALVESYRNRISLKDESINIPYTFEGVETVTHEKLVARELSASVTGFSLIGVSGCGKSSCINVLTSNYPQVITHHPKDSVPIRQIVYLKVVCPQGSNFNVLYTEIGKQIDLALGNVIPVYEEMIAKKKNLGKKAQEVERLIELFHIGIIIFDEIQQVNVSAANENTIESLLTINNNTNVAIAVVGTEETYNKLFKAKRVVRRLGVFIPASRYCENMRIFSNNLELLFEYTWVNARISMSEELKNSIYNITDGVIDQMIKLYKYIQIDLVKAENNAKKNHKPFETVVNVDFIKRTASKHSIGKMNKHISSVSNTDLSMFDSIFYYNTNTSEQIDLQRQAEKEFDEMIQDNKVEQIAKLKEKTIQIVRIKSKKKYSSSRIGTIFDNVIKNNNELTDERLADLIFDILERNDGKKNKPSHKQMVTAIKDKDVIALNYMEPLKKEDYDREEF